MHPRRLPGGENLKSLIKAIDMFCYRHPRFGIPNLMLYVVAGNIIVFLFSAMDTTGTLTQLLRFNPYYIVNGQVWRLITFIFVSYNTDMLYLAITLYFYYFVGSTLEREWGTGKFTIYYLFGIILTILYGFIIWFSRGAGDAYASVSVKYINLSLFLAFGTMLPDTRIMLFFFIPVKVKWLALLSGAVFIFDIFRATFPVNMFPENLLPVVAILNYFLFCGGYLIDYLRPYIGSGRGRNRPINYKKAAKKIQREMKDAPYTRKCAVCGKTDTENPEMEFRFCSRCEGYHCFCLDHINNHVHFTE